MRDRKAKLVQGRQSSPDSSRTHTPETNQGFVCAIDVGLGEVGAGHCEHPWVVSKLSYWVEVLINVARLNGL